MTPAEYLKSIAGRWDREFLANASLRVAGTFGLPFTSRVYVRDVAAIIGDELKGVAV